MKRIVLALLAGLFVGGECWAGGYAQLGVTAQFGTPVVPMYGAPVIGRQPMLLGYREVLSDLQRCRDAGTFDPRTHWCMGRPIRNRTGDVIGYKAVIVPKVPADLR